MTVSRRLRFEVLRRDGYTCRYCGAQAPEVVLTVDHVVPVTLGGGDDPRNLVAACQDCNSGKSSVQPDAALVDDVDATAMMFAKAVERAANDRRAALHGADTAVDRLDAAWTANFGVQGSHGDAARPGDWATSVERFYSLGLDEADLERFVQITKRKFGYGGWGAWKFFCGCCWRELGERQEIARRLIEDGEV